MSAKGDSAFLTQKGEKLTEVKREIADLEQLLAGATQTSQSTSLLKKRKEMREVDNALEDMKRDYKCRMDLCEERRIQFELRQGKMREQVCKFEKFIQENDAKRQRAELKCKQERKLYEEKCKELSSLADNLEELMRKQKELEADLVLKSCYKVYLERVVEEADHGYEEMSDILNRYKTLNESNDDLMKNVQNQDKEVDKARYMLQVLRVEKQNQLLVSNSLFGQNQKDLEKMRTAVKDEEEEKDIQEDNRKNVSREFSQIVQAIRNLYNRCQTTMKNKVKTPVVNKEQADYHLEVIHSRVIDLLEIYEEYRLNLTSAGANGFAASMSSLDLKEGSASTTLTAGQGLK